MHVFTNHPLTAEVDFDRGTYRELAWQQKSSTSGDDSDVYAEIVCAVAGSFNFFFMYENGYVFLSLFLTEILVTI